MPVEKKLSALEEAEFEDEGGEEGALEKEMFSRGLSCLQLILNDVRLFFFFFLLLCLFSCVADHKIENTCRVSTCLCEVLSRWGG